MWYTEKRASWNVHELEGIEKRSSAKGKQSKWRWRSHYFHWSHIFEHDGFWMGRAVIDICWSLLYKAWRSLGLRISSMMKECLPSYVLPADVVKDPRRAALQGCLCSYTRFNDSERFRR